MLAWRVTEPRRVVLQKDAAQELWEWGLRLGAKFQTLMLGAFEAYVNALRSALDDVGPQQLAAAERSDAWVQADKALFDAWLGAVKEIIVASGQRELGRLSDKSKEKFLVDNPYTVQWLETHGSDLVKGVSDQTKSAIRETVFTGVREHKPIREIGREVRPLIGLRPDQTAALRSYTARLEADGQLSDEQVWKKANNYARQLLNQRAEMIARTEVLTGQNAGIQQSWQVARDRGLIAPMSKRVWIAGIEKVRRRTCTRCLAMHRKKATLDGNFTDDDGDEISLPPLHPQCRCRVALVTEVD